MKLINLIDNLFSPGDMEEFYKLNKLNTESECIITYMKGALSIDSEIVFFDIEETDDLLLFEKNGIKYYQFFPLDYAKELAEDFLEAGFKGTQLAARLLEYRIKDA